MTTFNENERQPVIGFDMGGTSTDVSRFGGDYELVFETETAGVRIQAPQLHIKTVAAGGVGFRYRLARKMGMQAGVDVARGPEDTAFYLTIGNAW